MVIQSFIFLRHSVSLDSLEVSSGLLRYIVECHQHNMETNPVFSNNITKGQNMYNENSRGPRTDPCGTHSLLVIIEMTPRLNKQSVNDRTGRI